MQSIEVKGRTRTFLIEYDDGQGRVRIDGVLVSVELLEQMFTRSTEPGRWLRFKRVEDVVIMETVTVERLIAEHLAQV